MHLVAQHLAEQLAEEERQRLARYKAAWLRYDGEFPKPLKKKPDQPDHNVIVNLAALIVDTGVSFLFGKDVTFELDRQRDTPSAEEQWLEQAWQANRKQSLLMRLALNGGVCGHVFVKLVQAQPYPRLVNLDPAIVKPTWDPHDIEKLVKVTIQFTGLRPSDGKLVTYRQRIEPDGALTGQGPAAWHITDEEQLVGSSVWVTTNEEAWPYPICPVQHAQNLPKPNEFWGKADLEKDVTDLNEALNFLLSNLNRILYFHAHPKTVGKGLAGTGKQLDMAVDGTILIPAAADLYTLEMQGDLSSSLDLYHKVKEALHQVAQLPEIASGKVEDIGQLSGLALKILYGPLLQRTGVKRILYGDLLTDLNRGLLLLGNKSAERPITNVWQDALPSDPKTDAETAILDKQIGVSEDTLMQKRGYDPDVERTKRAAHEPTPSAAPGGAAQPKEAA
jgi:hypothetical protein